MKPVHITHTIILLIVTISALSCSSKEKVKTNTSNIKQIQIAEAVESKHPLNASTLGLKSFNYVQLETNEHTLKLGNPYSVTSIDDSLLLVKSYLQIALFNKKTGKYISHLGKFGEDPESYGFVSTSVNDRLDQRLVSAHSLGAKEIIEYNIDTRKVTNRTNILNALIKNDSALAPNFIRIYDLFFENKENIWGFLPNLYGDTPFRLIKFNEDGQIKKAYPQGQMIEERPMVDKVHTGEAMFYKYRDSIMFKESYSDTLFSINEESMTPRYVFNLADKSPPYKDKNYHHFPDRASYDRHEYPFPYVDRTVYIFIKSIIENDDFLIFSTMYKEELSYGFYDKNTQATYISNLPNDPVHGFYNDIDDFIPFRPNSIDRNRKQLIGFVTAEDVLSWFEQNPELANKLPEELSAFSQMQTEDNPIVMIGTLK